MNRPYSLLTRFSLPFLFILATASPAKADLTYVVKRGDSLSSIAKKFHLSIEEIQEANELDDTKILAGQNLTIPGIDPGDTATEKKKGKKPEASQDELPELKMPETHIVKKGETLAKIAYRYHLRVKDLEEINQLQGKKIRPGQIIDLQRIREAHEGKGEGKSEQAEKKKEEDAEGSKVRVKGSGFLVDERDRELLVRVAKSFLGLRYRRGGTSINGMDCSFFVQKIFKTFGIDLPRTTREQFQVGYKIAQEALCMGDLVFFKRGQARRPTHVGIYIGNDQFIHTSLSKGRVEMSSLASRYFSTRFIGARRIEEAEKQPETEGAALN
ncbi:MAG: LysM peptidoglycan-binding domain-containing protein [Deltaproteobacteria bacterium]|nr:LysM peptidoglycan-binding domain-containing protein [Deltaproteobacteria bacterium]